MIIGKDLKGPLCKGNWISTRQQCIRQSKEKGAPVDTHRHPDLCAVVTRGCLEHIHDFQQQIRIVRQLRRQVEHMVAVGGSSAASGNRTLLLMLARIS